MSTSALDLAMPEVDWGFDLIEDMPERIASLEAEGKRCVPVRYKGGVAWLVVGYESVDRVFRDEAGLPAFNFNHAYMDAVGFSLFHLENAEHKAYKTAVLSMLSPMVAKRLTTTLIAPIADGLIDGFGSRREVDFLVSFGRLYGFRVLSAMFGMTVAPEEEESLRATVNELSQIQDPHATRDELRQRALVAKANMNELLRPLVEKRRKEPGDDLISSIIKLEIGGRSLDDEEVMDFARHIYEGGAGSTGLQLSNILNAILGDPAIRDVMVAQPEKRQIAIEELLRLNSISGLISRMTTTDTEIAGTIVPAGSLVLLCIPGANRSSSHFDNPEQFSLEKRRPPLTFGAGVRMCPGQHLARREINIGIDRILDRLPGLHIVGTPSRLAGSQARILYDGMVVGFDDILPSDAVPLRL